MEEYSLQIVGGAGISFDRRRAPFSEVGFGDYPIEKKRGPLPGNSLISMVAHTFALLCLAISTAIRIYSRFWHSSNERQWS